MTDRELLELAAKAAGMSDWAYAEKWGCMSKIRHSVGFYFDKDWNPLVNDGDALRLAVKFNLLYMPYPNDFAVRVTRLDLPEFIEYYANTNDPCAATRRAIVRAAAEIGKQMGGSDD